MKVTSFVVSISICVVLHNTITATDIAVEDSQLRDFITSVSRQFEIRRLSKADQIIEYALSNKLSKTDIIRVARDLADDSSRRVCEEADPKKIVTEIMKCNCVFSLLGKLEDYSVLDFLEQKSIHPNELIRVDSSVAYVRIAGIDAIPFIEKKRRDGQFSERGLCKLFDVFKTHIAKKKRNNDEYAVNKAIRFLMTTLENENNGEIASHLDKMLDVFLTDYNMSLQRFQVMERLAKHENVYYRNLFATILNEIEKTPKEKRKDFKARGELLDPDRGK